MSKTWIIARLLAAASRTGRILALPAYALSVVTAAKSFRGNPVIGSPALNRLGLHVVRRRLAAPLGRLRRRQLAGLVSDADRVSFERDGFVAKPGFLDDATFRAFRDEVLGLEADAREAIIGDMLTRLIPLDRRTLARLPVTRSVLEGKAYLNLLAFVGSFRRRPHLYIQTVFSRYCDAEPDIQSFFHSDTFHPTVKSWFFLEDVPEDATPFTYVPGSHRMTRRRLAWERKASITARDGTDRLTAEGSFRYTEQDIRRLGYAAPVKLPVTANTLVVADTSGIHARGTAAGKTVRAAIWGYSRSTPFLPWPGGDLASLPLLKGRTQRLYWAVTDRWKDLTGARRDWRWVGKRKPLEPPPEG